uniref:Uncharacterized protein n=1 Tax=Utricularia reniformis TaxID=192314 RepID=A0A1Y0B454_9LAMI|nr:hypothetical protein AEK19_MT2033 [Utricularia reniformis]ART32192.1 hypothetical protein AEK19_MT2033 [Utricularia reniformis]
MKQRFRKLRLSLVRLENHYRGSSREKEKKNRSFLEGCPRPHFRPPRDSLACFKTNK